MSYTIDNGETVFSSEELPNGSQDLLLGEISDAFKLHGIETVLYKMQPEGTWWFRIVCDFETTGGVHRIKKLFSLINSYNQLEQTGSGGVIKWLWLPGNGCVIPRTLETNIMLVAAGEESIEVVRHLCAYLVGTASVVKLSKEDES